MPQVQPWPIKAFGWGIEDLNSDESLSNLQTKLDQEGCPIMMERPNPAINPTYVDTRRRFRGSIFESSQTLDPAHPNPAATPQNLARIQFSAPPFEKQQASGVKSTNPTRRPPRDAEATERGEDYGQGEEWEIRVQLSHSIGGKIFWNIDGIRLKERQTYLEKMVSWYEGECQRAPQLTRQAATLRLVAGFIGSL